MQVYGGRVRQVYGSKTLNVQPNSSFHTFFDVKVLVHQEEEPK